MEAPARPRAKEKIMLRSAECLGEGEAKFSWNITRRVPTEMLNQESYLIYPTTVFNSVEIIAHLFLLSPGVTDAKR